MVPGVAIQDEITVPAEYVRQVGEQLASMGVSIDQWLAWSGVAARLVDAPDAVLSYADYRSLVRTALRASGEPALGLFVGERLGAGTHGVVGAAAVNSETVLQAVDVATRFSALRTGMIVLSSEVGAHDARLRFDAAVPLGDIERTVLEAVLLGIKRILDEITLGRVHLREVAFPFPAPAYAALARDMFGCPVRYEREWTGLRVPLTALGLPIHHADPNVFEEVARVCQHELDRLAEGETYATRVRRLLLEKQSGFPSLQVAARHFHVTPRTLHRRLVAEGTSYRELLESVRHALATEHLKSGRMSTSEIAFRLGYSDVANFRRAFRRWEGKPPSQYRGE